MTVSQFTHWTVGSAAIVAVLACAAVGRSETKADGEVSSGVMPDERIVLLVAVSSPLILPAPASQ